MTPHRKHHRVWDQSVKCCSQEGESDESDAWHGYIGEATIADAILDQLVHNAHRVELKGAWLRKKRSGEPRAASLRSDRMIAFPCDE